MTKVHKYNHAEGDFVRSLLSGRIYNLNGFLKHTMVCHRENGGVFFGENERGSLLQAAVTSGYACRVPGKSRFSRVGSWLSISEMEGKTRKTTTSSFRRVERQISPLAVIAMYGFQYSETVAQPPMLSNSPRWLSETLGGWMIEIQARYRAPRIPSISSRGRVDVRVPRRLLRSTSLR